MNDKPKPKIGDWSCFCCIHDLYKIETQEEADQIEWDSQDWGRRYWPTLKEALDALKHEYTNDKDELGRGIAIGLARGAGIEEGY